MYLKNVKIVIKLITRFYFSSHTLLMYAHFLRNKLKIIRYVILNVIPILFRLV